MKTCKDCGQDKNIEDFVLRTDTKKPTYRPFCKECWQVKQRAFAMARATKRTITKHLKDTDLKTCSKCGIEKTRADFYNYTMGSDGKYSHCKLCDIEQNKKYKKNTPTHRKHQKLMTRYKVKLTQYQQMFKEQNGLCAICGNPESSRDNNTECGVRDLSIDHDHVTGAIRGLLCGRCNSALGLFMDDPERMQSAINYLKSHGSEPKQVEMKQLPPDDMLRELHQSRW